MKKLLILFTLILMLPAAAFAKTPAEELSEFRQAENQAQSGYFAVINDLSNFLSINREYYPDFSPITAKFYGKKLISQHKKAVAAIKNIPYSPAIKNARDAAVDKAEKDLALNAKAINLIKQNLPKNEIMDALEEERITATIADQKYEKEITQILGSYQRLPRPKKPLHPSTFRKSTLDDGSILLTGLITNNTGNAVHDLSITFTLYDANGRKIGTVSDTTATLTKGDYWQFAIKTPTPDFKYAKMEKIIYK